jgi:hypothetical protein
LRFLERSPVDCRSQALNSLNQTPLLCGKRQIESEGSTAEGEQPEENGFCE